MKYFLVLCFCAVVYSTSVTVVINGKEKTYYYIDKAEQLFEQFIVKFEKNYQSEEEKLMRFEIFKNSLQVINDLNMKHQTSHGITPFTDLTFEEFSQKYTGILPEEMAMPCQLMPIKHSSVQLGNKLDWRDYNIVSPVKNQRDCGSCWAHSIIGCLESKYAFKYGQMLDLSEQQLLDCEPTNDGCGPPPRGGGWPSNGALYLIDHGSVSEYDYPYVDAKGRCVNHTVVAQPKQCIDFLGSSEQDLMAILAQHGPISVVIDGTVITNQHYVGGVTPYCETKTCSHAVLLVGYNQESPEGPHWILKNSWGTDWGEQGYFKIPMGQGACNILRCQLTGLEV